MQSTKVLSRAAAVNGEHGIKRDSSRQQAPLVIHSVTNFCEEYFIVGIRALSLTPR